MAKEDSNLESKDGQDVVWSSRQQVRSGPERRSGEDRRQHAGGRVITVPDMRTGIDRRSDSNRRKVRLTITGRAIDI